MGVLTVALRRADSNNAFADVYMQSMTPLIKMAAESDETLDKALDKRLPEEVDAVPSTLVVGKMVSVKGVLYVGGPTGAPVKVSYSHPTSSGNKHLPAGGTKGQYLINADGEGGGEWADLPAASTTKAGIVQLSDGVTVADATKAATANAVKKAYDKANHSHPYVPTSQVGAKGGVAPLDENGIISSTYLPSYVDDVIDGTISDDLSTFTDTDSKAVTPEAGKIYNDITKNKSYRWSGSAYVSLNDGVALGETEKTAYRGDRGKVAYEHSQSAHARTDATKTEKSNTNGNVKINGSDVTVYTHPTHTVAAEGFYKVTVDELGHVTKTTAVAKGDITALGIPAQDTTYNDATQATHGLLTAADKKKLDGVEDGANKTVVSTEITKEDANPVAGGAVWSALSNKANASSLANKQDKVTGAATTIVSDDLTAGRVVVSNDSGKVAVSDITATELGYLDGVTSNVQTQINAKAPLANPSFTGKPTAVTPDATDNGTRLATTAFVQTVVSGLLDAKDAFHFVGTLAGGDTLPAAESGHVYRITSDGTINGLTVHQGDTITCCVDGTKAGTPANWFVTHTNHDGQVMGPTTAVDSHVAVYDGSTGKLIKDSGFTIGASVPADAKFTDTVYTHPVSGVTPDSYGFDSSSFADEDNVGYGEFFTVPTFTVDKDGHITSAKSTMVTLPDAPTTITGNAGSATKLAAPRTIKFTGDVTGSFAFDGSADVSAALSAAVSAIKEQNGHIPTYMWIGTSAQYKALTKKYTEAVDDTLYFVTDEEGTDSFMSGVKLNGKLLTLSSGVASINALTGITLDGVTVTTSSGIAALTTPKLTYNGNAISKTNETFAIVDNIQSIKMNGKVVSPDASHAVNLSAITSIKLGNNSMSVTNGAATLSNMGRIFYGTGDPSSSTGADGDIYIKYS